MIDLAIGWTVVLDVVLWGVISTVTGYLAHRAPVARFAHDGPLTRLRPFEDSGRWYERHLAIKRWKGRLPEAGGLSSGGPTGLAPARGPAGAERGCSAG